MRKVLALFFYFTFLLGLQSCSSGLPLRGPQDGGDPSLSDANEANLESSEIGQEKQILGSSAIEDEWRPKKIGGVYYLYGAEQLKLENYFFDIPVVYNPHVKKWMNYFLGRGRVYFERYGKRAGRYAPIMGAILEKYGLPRDLIFLAMAEAGFRNDARSWAGATGPWQFMSYTAKRYGLEINFTVDERQDPLKATIAAASYLKKLYGDFSNWELAIAAYNAGEGKIKRAIRTYGTENFWKIRQGRYLKNETKDYVPKIMALAIIGKNLRSFGFNNLEFHKVLEFEEIELVSAVDLMKFSEALNTPFSELQRLNPELKRWYTPLGDKPYRLRVPVGTLANWPEDASQELLASLSPRDFRPYQIKGGRASLEEVAKKFRLPVEELKKISGLMTSGQQSFKRGESVYLPFHETHSSQHPLYADLYRLPPKRVQSRKKYRQLIAKALREGRKISSPTSYYTVKKGDTLWDVAKKSGISLDSLIASNIALIQSRMIREGDQLVVR